jgi:hypothetical protein
MGIGRQPGKQITYHLPAHRWIETEFAESTRRRMCWCGCAAMTIVPAFRSGLALKWRCIVPRINRQSIPAVRWASLAFFGGRVSPVIHRSADQGGRSAGADLQAAFSARLRLAAPASQFSSRRPRLAAAGRWWWTATAFLLAICRTCYGLRGVGPFSHAARRAAPWPPSSSPYRTPRSSEADIPI